MTLCCHIAQVISYSAFISERRQRLKWTCIYYDLYLDLSLEQLYKLTVISNIKTNVVFRSQMDGCNCSINLVTSFLHYLTAINKKMKDDYASFTRYFSLRTSSELLELGLQSAITAVKVCRRLLPIHACSGFLCG